MIQRQGKPTDSLIVVNAVWVLVLSATLGVAQEPKTSNAPFLKPAAAVAKMSIPDGFDVKVFAAEPDIGEPIAFCFDDRGRLWVAENLNYRTRRNHTQDKVSRIQILEDTNGDGVFDKKKTFIDSLTFTSGIALGFGGVFVGAPPNLIFIPDADGDDRPDGPAKVLLDGWGINDRHETLNSFIWGPDGWLYGCHGVFTHSRVGRPGTKPQDRQFIDGGIWRYHPTQKRFEVFARGLSNPWGFDFNNHGQGFATCCVIPHLFHVVQGGTYHKQSRPHLNPYIYDDIKTIRDHTHKSAHGGARFYLADAFPEKYHNRLFMCNIHEHAVLTDIMVPKGSSFIGKHGDDFMPTNDLAWVGFSVEIGPEGGVYIMDWHDTDICGNAVNFPNSGRIYRIMPKGAKPIKRPNLRELSDSQLVELQMHRNDWYVRQARVLLHSRAAAGKLDKAAVHKQLWTLMKDAKTSGKRLRAVWALYVTGAFDGPQRQRLMRLLSHDDEYVRAWSVQLLCEDAGVHAFQPLPRLKLNGLTKSELEQLASMATKDNSAVVRLYLASAAARLPLGNRWGILSGLVTHAEDVDDANIPRMIWYALEPLVVKDAEKALGVAVAGRIPKLSEFVARRVTAEDERIEFQDPRLSFGNPRQFHRRLQRVAPGFSVKNVGEKGVVFHTKFRNTAAVQTHPLNPRVPCVISRKVELPGKKKTTLKMRVSHHPHGDWQLRVLVGKDILADRIVSSKTVKSDEWLNVEVDLSKYAGKAVELKIENRANNWRNEWAYWNSIKLVTED